MAKLSRKDALNFAACQKQATTHDHKAPAKTPLRMSGAICNFTISVDKWPQSHCLVAVLSFDFLSTIDHFRKAENRSAEKTDPSYHFLLKK